MRRQVRGLLAELLLLPFISAALLLGNRCHVGKLENIVHFLEASHLALQRRIGNVESLREEFTTTTITQV